MKCLKQYSLFYLETECNSKLPRSRVIKLDANLFTFIGKTSHTTWEALFILIVLRVTWSSKLINAHQLIPAEIIAAPLLAGVTSRVNSWLVEARRFQFVGLKFCEGSPTFLDALLGSIRCKRSIVLITFQTKVSLTSPIFRIYSKVVRNI